MSAWMASDDDFFVVRRFGTIGARVMLYMQDQVVELEERLRKVDSECMEAEPAMDNGTFRQDPDLRRAKIIESLSIKLERYRKNYTCM